MFIWHFDEIHPPVVLEKFSALPTKGFIWINCKPDEIIAIATAIKEVTGIEIHDRHIQDCQNSQHPCFFDSMQDYDFLIFSSLSLPPQLGKIITHPVCFILFDKFLVTVNDNDNAINSVKERLLEPGRRQPNKPEILLLIILNSIVDNFLALRAPLTEQFTRWQNKLLDEKGHFKSWRGLLKYKANIRYLYMLGEEQEDALGKWRQNMEVDLSKNLSVRLNDLMNHVQRVLHYTQALENELDSLMQLHYAAISQRTNNVVRVLTVISAIFLPLTLITNIFGMNFESMIGLQNPNGFYMTIAAMGAIAIALLLLFKWQKWI
jgi:magnesium/cobalt transport protein CorA